MLSAGLRLWVRSFFHFFTAHRLSNRASAIFAAPRETESSRTANPGKPQVLSRPIARLSSTNSSGESVSGRLRRSMPVRASSCSTSSPLNS